MFTVDHQPDQHNRVADRARPTFGRTRLFHPCGGRAIGGVSWPIATGESFAHNDSAVDTTFVIGVVDTGLIRQPGVHPWFAGHVNDDESNEDPLPVPQVPLRPDDAHGTFVAGLILREAPQAFIRMIRAIDEDAGGGSQTLRNQARALTDHSVAQAIRALSDTGPTPTGLPTARLINLSFCGELWEEPPPEEIGQAITDALHKGIVVVAAGGNDPAGTTLWPGAFAGSPGFDNMYTVGAVDETASRLGGGPPPKALYSNHGAWITAFANGTNVLGPYADHPAVARRPEYRGWARWSGTSFATATVTGLIAQAAMLAGGTTEQTVSAAKALLTDHLVPAIPEDPTGQAVSYLQGVDSTWDRDDWDEYGATPVA